MKLYKLILIAITLIIISSFAQIVHEPVIMVPSPPPEEVIPVIDSVAYRDSINTIECASRLHEKALKVQRENRHGVLSHNNFLEKLAWRESRGNWKVVNRFGYIGKYQFGKAAIKSVGLDINVDTFRTHPEIFPEAVQDSVINIYIAKNQRLLKSYIPKYANKTIHDIKVTESGLIGAAHLVGHGNVKKWLRSNGNIIPADGNGVSIEEYIALFANYTI